MELEKCSICGGEAEFVVIKSSTLCDCHGKPTDVEVLFNVKCNKCGKQINSYEFCILLHVDGGAEEINLDSFRIAADNWNNWNKYNAQVDWSKVPVDTPIYVQDRISDIWYPRYFAKFKDRQVYAWYDGKTSFTVGSDDAIPWAYAKLADEEAFKKQMEGDEITFE